MLLNELVALAIQGDRRATEKLLTTVRAMVLPYCRARLGGQQHTINSAEDVAQDICLAVLITLAHYQVRGLSFRAFVYGIAAHKVTDAYRAAARERSEPIAEVDALATNYDSPEQRVLHAEQSERLGRLLTVLSDLQREILILRVVIGLSATETAQAVRSTAGSVRVLHHRALTRLRVALLASGLGSQLIDAPVNRAQHDLLCVKNGQSSTPRIQHEDTGTHLPL